MAPRPNVEPRLASGRVRTQVREQDEPTIAQFAGWYPFAVDWQPASTLITPPITSITIISRIRFVRTLSSRRLSPACRSAPYRAGSAFIG
jgi:hypothetical protein